jgi:hypothetical protein
MWKPTSRKTQPTESGFHSILPTGEMAKSFTLRVPPEFSQELREIADGLKGEWSKADIVRLAVGRLKEQLKVGDSSLGKLMK